MGNKDSHDKYDHCFHVLVLGDPQVGKTTFIEQLGKLPGTTLSANKAQVSQVIGIGEMKVKLILTNLQKWRQCNQNIKEKKLFGNFCGAFILVDVTNQSSFDNIRTWLEETKKFGTGENPKRLPKVILGNKADLVDERKISREEAYSWGKMLETMKAGENLDYAEISCKNGTNVDVVIQDLGEMIKEHLESGLCLIGQSVMWFWWEIETEDKFL